MLTDPRRDILTFLKESHGHVEELYAIDKRAPFNALTTASENKPFASERLVFGSQMLRDLWWTAWVTSVDPGATALLSPRDSDSRHVGTPQLSRIGG